MTGITQFLKNNIIRDFTYEYRPEKSFQYKMQPQVLLRKMLRLVLKNN